MLIHIDTIAQFSKGGCCSLNEHDVFSFNLNESLYFEKGQEVAQMLSISLEPEISIQSFNEYVSIRGVIELQGEYEIDQPDDEEEENLLNFDDHHSRRYFEEIRNNENGSATFSHRFPVEISVPAYRVDNTNDIKVNVASFDYEISEGSQFRLISTIEIHGISNEAVVPEDVSERIEDEEEQKLEMLGEQFEFELKDELRAGIEQDENSREIEPEKAEQKDSENEEVDTDKDRWKYKQTQSFEEFFKEDDEKEEVAKADGDHETAESDLDVHEETESAEAPERVPSYLTDLFGNDDSEEVPKFEQMRICIVQEQDTLESISERYQVPKLQLLKLNRLADDDLAKGQLLTIPSKK